VKAWFILSLDFISSVVMYTSFSVFGIGARDGGRSPRVGEAWFSIGLVSRGNTMPDSYQYKKI
jgi:hypothetical protein